jgi:hypothetical protein
MRHPGRLLRESGEWQQCQQPDGQTEFHGASRIFGEA